MASASEKFKNQASNVADKARDTASNVADKARGMASTAVQTASDLAATAGERAEDATSAVASGMQSLAGTIRENLPHSGMMGTATSSVADTLERGGRYLQQEGLQGIADDLGGLIRRYPIQAVLIGIGVGFLLARSTRD
jgi:hypothetical protein